MSFEEGITGLSPSGKISMLLYSRPGAGKTALIGSSTQRVLILRPPTDHTDSITTVHGTKPRIKERTVADWNTMDDARNWARQEQGGEFDWIWLDSGSLYQKHGLDDIWNTVLASPKGAARRVYGLDKGEYGVNMERFGQWTRDMVSLPGFHFGMTAHTMEVEDAETNALVMMPYIQGKDMAPQFCGYMNIVAYLSVKEDKGRTARILRTAPHQRYFAKDQFGALGTMRNPTLDRIVELTKGRIASPTSRTRPARRTRRSTSK